MGFWNFQKCCGCSEGTSLPQYVEVTFSGITRSDSKTYFTSLEFSSCYGSGAAGRAASPGGEPGVDNGPLSAVELTNPGSGYARLGREEPVVTASAPGDGTGATFAVTLSHQTDDCGLDYWKVHSVSVSGGTGYQDNDQISFSVSGGGTEESAATAVLRVPRAAPALTITGGGTGAVIAVSYSQSGSPPDNVWSIGSVSVSSGGSGYVHGEPLTIVLAAGDVEAQAGSLTAITVFEEPTLSAAPGYAVYGGTGATFGTPVLATFTPPPWMNFNADTLWEVQSVPVTNAGSGYLAWYDEVVISVVDGTQVSQAYAVVASVDENGGITSVAVYGGGAFFKDTGALSGAAIQYGGSYYKSLGNASSVQISDGGVYYKENASLSPYVASVAVTITQSDPSSGDGAVVTATVNQNTASPEFGQIDSLAVSYGGSDGYLAWRYQPCDGLKWNGSTFLVPYRECQCCKYEKCVDEPSGTVSVQWNGQIAPPTVRIKGDCDITFTADPEESPFSCSPVSFTAAGGGGGVASVVSSSKTLPTCQEILDSDTLLMTVSSPDYLLHYKQKWHQFDNYNVSWDFYTWYTVWFGGADFCGDFELQKVASTPFYNLWGYNYPSGSCQRKASARSGRSWDRLIAMNKTTKQINFSAVTGYTGIYRASVGDLLHQPPSDVADFKSPEDFQCLGPPIASSEVFDPLWRRIAGGDNLSCECDLESLTFFSRVCQAVALPHKRDCKDCLSSPISDAFFSGCWTLGESQSTSNYLSTGYRLDESEVVDESGDPNGIIKITISMPS